MAKSNKSRQNNHGASPGGGGTSPAPAKVQKRKREVQVVVCPSAFPDFTTVGGSTSRRRQQRLRELAPERDDDHAKKDRERLMLDVQETIREVHKFGAEGFTGAMKKSHRDAEYERLTGRTVKRQKIPTKILVGMRKKALKREERRKQEEKESGVVSHHTASAQGKKKRKTKSQDEEERGGGGVRGVFGSNRARNTGNRRKMDPRSFGPAPDVGFMRKGILKVNQSRR